MLLEENPEHDSAIHAVFRAAHTIKGSAGLFGLSHIVAFTHSFEKRPGLHPQWRSRGGPARPLRIACSGPHKLLDRPAGVRHPPEEHFRASPGRELGNNGMPWPAVTPLPPPSFLACLPVLQETPTEPSLVDRHHGHTGQTEAWHPPPAPFAPAGRRVRPLSFILHLRELGEVLIHCVLRPAPCPWPSSNP